MPWLSSEVVKRGVVMHSQPLERRFHNCTEPMAAGSIATTLQQKILLVDLFS